MPVARARWRAEGPGLARGFVIRMRLRCPPERVWGRLVDPDARGPGHHCTVQDGTAAVVTEYQPKHRYALSSRWKDILTTHRYTLRGSQRGTDLVLRMMCDANGGWWARHSFSVMGLWLQDRRRLRRMKRELEAAEQGRS